jgi:SAM-dependent methyltransferase
VSASLPPLTFSASLRYDLIRRKLRELPGIESVLEIGAGEGAVGARLAQRHRYLGVEPDQAACAVAGARIEPLGGRVVCGDISALDPGSLFDLVCAFEVLEHIERHAEALAAWAEHARAGGWVMLSVPPFQRRFGPSDRAVGHFRRYEPEQMRELLLACGLMEPQIFLYGFPIGYALDAAKNALVKVVGADGSRAELTLASGRRFQPKGRIGGVISVLAVPFCLMQRPFHATTLGSGLLALARKPT